MARGVGNDCSRGTIILKYFRQRGMGDYLREAINRGRAIIRGNTVFKQSKMHVNVKSTT